MHWIFLSFVSLLILACGSQPTPMPTIATPQPVSIPAPADNLLTAQVPPQQYVIKPPPKQDPFALALEYFGVSANPLSSSRLYPEERLGEIKQFSVFDLPKHETFQVDAELIYLGQRASWYVDQQLDGHLDQSALERVAKHFDRKIYPLVVDSINGGVDLTGRVAILIADIPGVLGYFNADDQLPRDIRPFSNERAMLYMRYFPPLDGEHFLGTLAHELQHLVHYELDTEEVTWIHEGLSEYIAAKGEYGPIRDVPFVRKPNTPLTEWPLDPFASGPSYSAAALFIDYLFKRTDHRYIYELSSGHETGIKGIQSFLDRRLPNTSFDQLFSEWAISHVVHAPSGPYISKSRHMPVMSILSSFGSLDTRSSKVSQYGIRYVFVDQPSPAVLHFRGAETTPLLPVEPFSGNACWWSNRGDGISSRLTREIDLRGTSKPELRFWHWHDIEEDFDYAYVSVSQDSGKRWQALNGKNSSNDNPLGVALGPGFTGQTSDWREEVIDLSPFSGSVISLRYEYVTDSAVNGMGWCLDDISIPEIGFFDDAESESDWDASGFMKLPGNRVEQDFSVHWVQGKGDQAIVSKLPLDDRNDGSLEINKNGILVIVARTPQTRVQASFSLELTRK